MSTVTEIEVALAKLPAEQVCEVAIGSPPACCPDEIAEQLADINEGLRSLETDYSACYAGLEAIYNYIFNMFSIKRLNFLRKKIDTQGLIHDYLAQFSHLSSQLTLNDYHLVSFKDSPSVTHAHGESDGETRQHRVAARLLERPSDSHTRPTCPFAYRGRASC